MFDERYEPDSKYSDILHKKKYMCPGCRVKKDEPVECVVKFVAAPRHNSNDIVAVVSRTQQYLSKNNSLQAHIEAVECDIVSYSLHSLEWEHHMLEVEYLVERLNEQAAAKAANK
ncbi:hypothetical protein FRC07_005271 [Ceratobasidium sp. 392]|nr:hypothetical protein FRC07_005271 [Ceratobasidium sp. 392]